MSEKELISEAARLGYQLVPIPSVLDHNLRPGDLVEEIVPEFAQKLVTKAFKDTTKSILTELFTPRRGVILAVASRADVLIRYDDGRVGFSIVTSLTGEPRVRKVSNV